MAISGYICLHATLRTLSRLKRSLAVYLARLADAVPFDILHDELRRLVLGDENAANVLANRTETHQLDASKEEKRHDQRGISFRLLLERKRLEHEERSHPERQERDDSTSEH